MLKKEIQNSPDILSKKEKDALKDDLKQFGYLLPTNDEELEEFEKIYGTTQVMFPEHLKDPHILHKKVTNKLEAVRESQEKKSKPKKVTSNKAVIKPFPNNSYFKKLVLAAEIANQLHNEYTFGHVKFVKVLYLCEEICNMQFNSTYGKYAAGPLDPKSMYSIDSEFKKRNWFDIQKTNYGYKYSPRERLEEYKKYYLSYFSNQKDKIDHIISLFKKEKTEFCEIVATLYAVWKESLNKNCLVSDSNLIKGFYAWSSEKNRLQEKDVMKALMWMREQGIVPISLTA